MAEVQGLIEAGADVRLVYRERPILGEGSDFATRAALAARERGKYQAFYWARMGMSGKANETRALRIAREIGPDTDQLRRDMEAPEVAAHIAQSMALAQHRGSTAPLPLWAKTARHPVSWSTSDCRLRLTEHAKWWPGSIARRQRGIFELSSSRAVAPGACRG